MQPLEASSRRKLHALRLLQRDSIGDAYQVLTFETNEPIVAQPGQFAMVRSTTWGAAPLLPRPMSLLTVGRRPSILIKVVGEGTRRMAHASSGEVFELLAPLGVPWSPLPEGHRAIFVAGGVGVVPLVFLARESKLGRPLSLYGGRTAQDLPLSEELEQYTELRVATEDGSRGTRGRVTLLLAAALEEARSAREQVKIYTCGPDAMMAAVARLAAERGVLCEASLETPMACGYGVCLGCPVARVGGGFLYACTEGPCIDATRIAWPASSGGAR